MDTNQFVRYGVLASLLFAGSALAQERPAPRPELLASASLGGDVSCPYEQKPKKQTFTIPLQLIGKAKLKARLADALVESLRNDQDGKMDLKLDREIQDLMKKLR